jgi:hypothetical protein
MDLLKAVKALVVIVTACAAAILYFAPMSELEALDDRVTRGEINQEMLFHKKVILMLKDKCEAGGCDAEETTCYEESKHELETLREDKALLMQKKRGN